MAMLEVWSACYHSEFAEGCSSRLERKSLRNALKGGMWG